MFRSLLGKPKPPPDSLKNELRGWLKELKAHFESAYGMMEEMTDRSISKSIVEISAAKACVSQMRRVWPQGKRIWLEFDLCVESFDYLLRNAREMNQMSVDPNIDLTKYKKLVARNRYYGQEAQTHLDRAIKLLKSWTTLEFALDA